MVDVKARDFSHLSMRSALQHRKLSKKLTLWISALWRGGMMEKQAWISAR